MTNDLRIQKFKLDDIFSELLKIAVYTMATAAKVRDINECPICLDEYKFPQKWDCDHSLCESCLKRLDFGGVVKCPLCNKVCPSKNVKPDFRLQQFLEILREQELLRKTTHDSHLKEKNWKYT